jgi:2,3-bisphosphoglycerate-dependent phosphoglycerate mutase
MSVLVLLRHGESAWNAANVFTGWIVHTSVQRRAIWTANLALATCGRSWVPVRRSWRLNSNHYGALQGRSKPEVRAEAGGRAVHALASRIPGAPAARRAG